MTRRRKKKPVDTNKPRIIVTPIRGQVPKKVRLFYPKRKNIPPPPPAPTTPYTTKSPKLNLKGYDQTLRAFENHRKLHPELSKFEPTDSFTPNPKFEDEPLKTIEPYRHEPVSYVRDFDRISNPPKRETIIDNKNQFNTYQDFQVPGSSPGVHPYVEPKFQLTIPEFPAQPTLLDNLNLEFGQKLIPKSVTEKIVTTTRIPTPTYHSEIVTSTPLQAFENHRKLHPEVETVKLVYDDAKWHAVANPIGTTTTTSKPVIFKEKPLKTIDDYNFETIEDYNEGKLYNNDVGKLLVTDPYSNNAYPEEIYRDNIDL